MSLFISTRRPDHSLDESKINHAIVQLAARTALSRHEKNFPGGPSLEIIFMYPGAHEKPPFEGMRMGGYTPRHETLYFEAAIPSHITESNQVPGYLKQLMQDVLLNAREFFNQSNVIFDMEQWQTAMRRVVG